MVFRLGVARANGEVPTAVLAEPGCRRLLAGTTLDDWAVNGRLQCAQLSKRLSLFIQDPDDGVLGKNVRFSWNASE
jgi:hypothetical protein